MSYQVRELNQEERIRQKQADRDRDQERLRSGAVSREDLRRESSLIDPSRPASFKIVAIGDKPFGGAR